MADRIFAAVLLAVTIGYAVIAFTVILRLVILNIWFIILDIRATFPDQSDCMVANVR